MANEEQLEMLRQGVEVWNVWRVENRNIEPDLQGANLYKASLWKANLAEANLAEADLQGATLWEANLQRANLQRANLQGATLWGADLRKANLRGADLTEANLRKTNLQAADLWGANLQAADLTEANLRGVSFSRANLRGADLTEANLRGAYLWEADLRAAALQGANLWAADLQRADLMNAQLGNTNFGNVDLHEVKCLETVQHAGPSTIGIDTLYKSGGDIPERFLRGCGVPDSMIEYARALVAAERAIDYYSVFISYSSQDEAIAQRLHADLQARGVRCWFAPHNLEIGAPIVRGIDEAIRIYDKLLIILSEAAVTSRWVDFEVSTALHREVEQGRTMLFPIRLDDAVLHTPSGWAAQLRTRNIGDFRSWKDHDHYQAAFTRLLRDLKAKDQAGEQTSS